MQAPVILWFRRNLRLIDNPAVLAACASEQPVIAVYVHDALDTGGASRWWLHHSLASLTRSLEAHGVSLVLRNGDPVQLIPELAEQTGATALYCSRRYEPEARQQEKALRRALDESVERCVFDDYLLRKPGTVRTGSGSAYKVFTPFYIAASALGEPALPLAAPEKLAACEAPVASTPLDELGLLPTNPDWSGGLQAAWQPGEPGALDRLDTFASHATQYSVERDQPGIEGTSKLSPHLHFGEISPRQVWHAVRMDNNPDSVEPYLRQLYWRDFSWYLLFEFPGLPDTPLRPEYAHFPWSDDATTLAAWQQGRTGIPIVDAGMRELWTTGWMHNRVRMIVASFLVKNLLIPWQHGARWFEDTLVDADLGNNSAGWQWVAGCGTDAAPYFRIFNPVLQSRKFDPDGRYLRRWVPEIAALPDKLIHEPWSAKSAALEPAGITLGREYPAPIVDLAETRTRALDAYKEIRNLLQSGAASPGSSAG